MKKLINYPNHWNNLIKQKDLERFKNRISLISINEELIQFIDDTINGVDGIDQKILYLCFAKKVLMHIERKPDEEHLRAFREQYQRDREVFNPIKWIEVELEFWSDAKILTSERKTSSEIAQAKLSFSKQWLSQEQIQEMFSFSRSTLNRRVAEGMPFHQKGKSKFFDLEEVSEWMKEDEAA